MLKKVTEAITRFNLLQNAKHVTVALSGGADSMALLCVLCELKDELKLEKISAAHFNHEIRGDEALRDQSFVTDYCKQNGIELFIGSADVPQFAKDQGLSLELAARKLRYDFFESLDTDFIATAHTTSDNIETVLFNITRGTALSGLCGIPVKRDRYIRPLILCTRDDVESYCKKNNINYVTDSTNLCDDYTRNKIRHNVVPVLKDINTSVENTVSRMTAALREDDDFISGIAQSEYDKLICDDGLKLNDFSTLHPAIAKRILTKYCSSLDIEVDNYHINAIYDICLKGGKISISGENVAYKNNSILKLEKVNKPIENIDFKVDIQKQSNNLFENNKKVHNLLLKNVLDCDKIVGQLVLRSRQSGDKIRLKNKNCTKTLKKLFCEYKIPLELRKNLPVLADSEGVVWIYEIGVAERVAADECSKNIYKITVEQI